VTPAIPPAPMNFAYAMELVGARFSHIPLGLATVAALTPPGHVVEIVDENVEDAPLDGAALARGADVVAFTGIYCQRERLYALARAVREAGGRVAIGGPIADDLHDECRAVADHLLVGEAEEIWPRFIDDLARGRALSVYRQEEPVDVARSPIPRYDLLRAERYSAGCVQATRGCPYRCEYCDVPTKMGTRPRTKPIAQVLEEVRRQAALGFDSIFFVDDMFIANRRYARQLLEALAGLQAELPAPVVFYTQVTLNVARDEELLGWFRRAGFRRFFCGVETSRPTALRAIDKPQNLELDVDEAIRRIQAHNITVWAGLIVGLDDDDERTLAEQVRFVERTAIMPTLVGLLQAMPGAPLWERARREGRLRELDGIVGSGAHGDARAQGRSNLVPRGLSQAALFEGFARVVDAIYAPEAYGARVLAAIDRGAPDGWPRVAPMLTKKNALAVARTVRWYLTEADAPSRRMLARVLGGVAARRLRGLEEALFALVTYRHLRRFYGEAAAAAREAAARGTAGERRATEAA